MPFFKNILLACPPGTYKNFTGLGDINICIPCPDEHQTTPEGAVSIAQCVCKRGYRSFGHRSCTGKNIKKL